MSRQFEVFATDAVEHLPDHAVSAFLRCNPRTIDEWRVMTHVLRVPAGENRDWLAFAVMSKRYNRSFQKITPSVA